MTSQRFDGSSVFQILRRLATPENLLRLAVAVGIIHVAVFVMIALSRVGYPYELEWMEGGVIQHVDRILDGKSLYTQPSIRYVAYIYAPFYFYVVAAFVKVLGLNLFACRLVSLIAFLGSLALIFRIVRYETKDRVAGALAALFFVATFRISGAWFDLARVDSLFICLLLASVYLLRSRTGILSAIIAGALWALAFHTKQTGLVVILPLVLWLIWDCKRAAAFLVTCAAVALVPAWLMNRASSGWYWYFVIDLPGQHMIIWANVVRFWLLDILGKVAFALVLGLLWLGSALRSEETPIRTTTIFYVLLAVGMFTGSWLSRLHSGGFINVVIPAYAMIGILMGLGIGRARELAREDSGWHRNGLLSTLYALVLVQFLWLGYSPSAYIPSADDRKSGDDIVATISRIDGDVYIPYHGYLSRKAGKSDWAQYMAVADILRGLATDSASVAIRTKLEDEINQAIQRHDFSMILTSEPKTPHMQRTLSEHYSLSYRLSDSGMVLLPKTGFVVGPEFVYTPVTVSNPDYSTQ